MTPEQERALALARARQRKAQAEAQAQPAAPAMSPFIQKGIDMVNAPDRQPMRASFPAATAPDRMQNRTDSAVLAKARKVEQDIANATRKARVKPVEREAGRAGVAQLDQGPITANPNAAYSEFMLPPDAQRGLEAERGVYRANDVTSSLDAATLRGINSLALGIPAMVNEDFRNEVGAAGRDQPGASLAGDIAGYLIPGELAWQAGRGLYNATVRPAVNALMPQGGSALARTTRFGQRGVEQAGAWAGQNALFQATTGASTRAAEQGRPVTLEDITQGAQAGASDPINLLGPAGLMALNRLGKFVSSGGRTATPDSVVAEVAGRTAGRSGDGSVLNAQALDGPVDRRAERILVRMLGEVGYRPNDIRAALASFDQLANQTTDLPTLTARLKDVFIEQLGPRAEQVIQDFLQGAGVSRGGTAGAAVQSAAAEDYGRLSQFLEDSANARLGAGSRYDTLTAAQQEMQKIGKEGYERTFNAPATDPAAVDDLTRALQFFAGSELASPLRQIAAGKMLNVEQMIANDPRRAAHWMQMAAGQKAQEAFDAGNQVLGNAYTDMRKQILNRLENEGVAPGYQQARMKFGDEFGIEQAVTFGSRFFTKVTDTVGVRQLADDLRNLTPDQQEAALLSIRDELLRLAGRGRSGAAPRLTQLNTDASLGGLETVVGEKGGQLANDIRFIDERLARIRRTDPGQNSRTASNQEARDFADRAVSNPLARTVGKIMENIGGDVAVNAGISAASGNPSALPILSLRSGFRALGDQIARGRQGKIDDVTSLLLRDVGPQSRAPMPGDDMPPLTSNRTPPQGAPPTGAPPAGSQGVPQANIQAQIMWPTDIVKMNPDGTATFRPGSEGAKMAGQPANALSGIRNNESGFVSYPVSNALLGGAGGATYGSYKDVNGDGKVNWEDQAGGAMLGVAGMYGLQKGADTIAPMLPKSKSRWEASSLEDFATRVKADTKPKPVTRVATEDEYNEAIIEANRLIDLFAQSKGIPRENRKVMPGTDGPDDYAVTVADEIAMALMRNQGIDPAPVLRARQLARGTNAQDAATAARMDDLVRVLLRQITEGGSGTPNQPQALALDGGVPDEADEAIEYLSSLNMRDVKPNSFGIPTSVGDAAISGLMGSGTGSVMGSQYDLNGDGEINALDMQIGAGAGMAAFMGGPRAYGMAKNALTGTRPSGFGGGRRPPPDSPDAIREGVRDMASTVPPTPADAPLVAPRGQMRGTLQAPERVTPAQTAPAAPPPAPRYRPPGSPMPNAIEGGLMAATAATGAGALIAERMNKTRTSDIARLADDPATFGLTSFDQLPPDDPMRDPAYRQMLLMNAMQAPQPPRNALSGQ